MSMSPSATPCATASLLFCHGAGFGKNVWNPVLQRLAKMPLLQASPVTMHHFNFAYHDGRRGVSEKPVLHAQDGRAPRVTHSAMHWSQWAPEEVHQQVARIQACKGEDRHTPVVGIGHSLGAAALLAAEVERPGTFEALILFEPICNPHRLPNFTESTDFLVNITLQRRAAWDSFEEAEADLLATPNFAKWHPESLRAYIQGAVVANSATDNKVDPDAGAYVLACHPLIEASLYSGSPVQVDDEAMGRVRSPVTFLYGSRTRFFSPELMAPIMTAYPDLYRIGEPIPNTGHTMIMEDPDAAVDRIHAILAQMPVFQVDDRVDTNSRL